MADLFYIVVIISSVLYLPLLITGLLMILFPASAVNFRRKFWPLFYVLMAIALLSQVVTFGGLSGLEMEYGDQLGLSGFVTAMWPTALLFLMILIFLLSFYLQSKKIGKNKNKKVSLGVAFYSALTVTAPLYFLLSALLNYLF